MATTYSQQYRPITGSATVGETGDGDGLSTRALRDHIRNANNAAGRSISRVRVYTQWNPVLSYTGAAAVRAQWVIPIPDGFSTLQIKFMARVTVAGSGTVKVYSDKTLYRSTFTSDAVSALTTVTNTTFDWYSIDLPVVKAPSGFTHLALELSTAGAYNIVARTFAAFLKPLADA